MGVVGAPHGVRGEVRLKSFTQKPEALASFPALQLPDGRRLSITVARRLKDDMLVARFAGIADRDTAAALTNLSLFVARRDLPEPDAEEFYHADLIGLRVEAVDGAPCGRVVALQNFGAGDLLEIAPLEGDSVYVPFTRAFVPVVDLAGRRVVLAEGAIPSDEAPPEAQR